MQKQNTKLKSEIPLLNFTRLRFLFLRILIIIPLLSFSHNSIAQKSSIKGTITDPKGETLIGVSVTVKGTTVGVMTDVDGKYSIEGAPSSTLVFKYIGFIDQEINVSNRTEIDVVMKDDSKQLDEVVVVGYGVMRKVDLTGTVASIQNKDVANIPVTTAAEAITGKLAGVQVITTSGAPDAQVKIKVRGGGSISQDNSPLYIVDGFPVEDALSLISPSDIDRIDVLKDASSTAIYGARGANGVVIITTKSGSSSRTTISFDAYMGVRNIPEKLDMLSPYDYVVSAWERTRITANDLNAADMVNFISRYGDWDSYQNQYGKTKGTNWQDEAFRSGFVQNYNMSINGGNATTKYNMGVTRNIEEGALQGSSYSRTILNGKFEHNATKNLTVGFSVRYNHNTTFGGGKQNTAYGGAISTRDAVMYRPTEGIAGTLDWSDFDEEYLEKNDLVNPVLLSQEMYRKRIINNFNIMGEASYKINDFILKTQGGIDSYDVRLEEFEGPHTKDARKNNGPFATLTTTSKSKWINTNTINWSKLNIDDKHNVTAMLGHEWSDQRSKQFQLRGKEFPEYMQPKKAFGSMSLAGTFDKPSTLEDSYQLVSFFGRASYDYMSKYLVNASLRTDGSSNFSKDNRWGWFPSLGVAWRINEEDFMKKYDFINNLKVRYSLGVAGNDRISSLQWTTAWLTDATTQYGLNGSLNGALKPLALANPDIKWETTISNNLGIDLNLLNNRINFTFDFYNNETKDLLLAKALPANAGFPTQIQNIGRTRNRGVEIVVDGTIINTKDFTWTAGFNISFNKNKVLKLSDGINEFYQNAGISTAGPTNEYRVKVGDPVGQIYGYVYDGWYTADDFVDGTYNPATKSWTLKPSVAYESAYSPRPGDVKFKNMGGATDSNGNPIITEEDKTVIGNTNPKHFGGFNTTFTYKDFDLSAFFNWSYGNDIYNATKLNLYDGRATETNMLAEMKGRYSTIGANGEPITSLSELTARNANATMYSPYRGTFVCHSGIVEDGSFLRLNTLTLGYSFPKSILKKLNIQKLRVYFTGYNLACWTSYSGFDPEVDTFRASGLTSGVDYWDYPKTRSFIGGINLTF